MSIIIGLTGPTGSGKSSLAPVAESYGFKVVNCDLLARQATVKGSAGLKALTAVFGEEILNTDGSLNRKGLAAIAFSSSQKTELLNKTIFPYITELLMKEITGERVLLDAPT
ncbi:MAG: dephospho-CoA kinase, partial [Acutalibacteraceae bacterium]